MKPTALADAGEAVPACRADPELFFPHPSEHATIAEAKVICGRCPMLAMCAEVTLRDDPEYGVWAGTSEQDRKAARKLRERARVRAVRQPRGAAGKFGDGPRDAHIAQLLIDGVAVPGASNRDRAYASTLLRPSGMTTGQIGRRVGATDDQVRRWFRNADAGRPMVVRDPAKVAS